MTPLPLRAAFIGGGLNSAVGIAHQTAIHLDQKFQLTTGAFSLEADINIETGTRYNIDKTNVFLDWKDLITTGKHLFDVAIVLTPTPSHSEIVIQCIKEKIPVICEKALCTSTSEAREIFRALNQNEGYLAVIYNYSGYPMFRELRARIESGSLGTIKQIHVEMPQEGFIRKNRKTGQIGTPQAWRQQDGNISTLALDLGVHLHHIVGFLTQQKPLQVVAAENNFSSIPVIDNTIAVAKYTNNLVCNLWFGKCALGYRNGLKVRVFGEAGSAEWRQMDPEHLFFCDEYGLKTTIDRSDPDNFIANQDRYNRFKAGHPAGFIEAFANYYYDVAEHLLNQDNSNQFYVAGIEEAFSSLAFFEAISLSNRQASWVNIINKL